MVNLEHINNVGNSENNWDDLSTLLLSMEVKEMLLLHKLTNWLDLAMNVLRILGSSQLFWVSGFLFVIPKDSDMKEDEEK